MREDTLYLKLPNGIHNHCLEITASTHSLLSQVVAEFMHLILQSYNKMWFFQGTMDM